MGKFNNVTDFTQLFNSDYRGWDWKVNEERASQKRHRLQWSVPLVNDVLLFINRNIPTVFKNLSPLDRLQMRNVTSEFEAAKVLAVFITDSEV